MKRFFFCLIGCLFIAGCSSVPYSNRSQLLFISEEEEARMGSVAWQETLNTEKISNDPFLNSAVQRVGSAVAAVSERSDFKWEFKVFASEVPNAYCLPGGKVGVYTALFQYTDNDAELATVISHEVAHAICRHGGERVSQQTLQAAGAELIGAASSDSELAMMAYGLTTNLAAILPFSRTHELEADFVGLLLMAKAGYDPRHSITFWRKFGSLGSSKLMAYFSTHQHGEDRIDILNEKMKEALELYQKSEQKGVGTVYQKSDLKEAY